MSKKGSRLDRKDRRHFICSGITLLSVLFGILFLNSVPRLLESLWDLCTSLAFYIFKILLPDNNPITATVATLPEWTIGFEIWKPIRVLPETWEQFFEYWSAFLRLLFDPYNLLFFWFEVTDFLFYFSRFLLILLPLICLLIVSVMKSKKVKCTIRGKKSPALWRFQYFLFKRIYPVLDWCKAFKKFLQDNPRYMRTWLVIWALWFNFFSIGISFMAYYLYLIASWDLLSIYTQLLKLQRDLTPVIRFIPGIVWLVFFSKIYCLVCRFSGLSNLKAAERANRAVLSQSSIITTVYGEPGIGKTKLVTSMALSAQVQQFDSAFDIMLKRAAQFPNFPWQLFRDEITRHVDARIIVDIDSAKKWVSESRLLYDRVVKSLTPKQWARIVRKRGFYDVTFQYDFLHFRSVFSDELKMVHLYDALESYAAAFLIFSVNTNLLFTNYSIRSDTVLKDLGNLPLRDNNFFDRDPELQDVYSQHSHIIDFNVIRLGKKFQQNLYKSNGAPVGVIVVTEIDKEFKNMQLLKETKINDQEVNQKNDLHDAALMMIRHGVVVDNVPFVCVLADLQRPEAWGAGGRELGNVVFIADKIKLQPVLPFFSSYWFTEGIYSWIRKAWDRFYSDFCYRRSDDTLPIFLIRNLITFCNNHYDRINNYFGMETMYLEVQSGRMDGKLREDKWRILSKKDYSKRYRTDCLASVFDRYAPNTMHIDDFQCYAGELATREECDLQNSFFQKDVHQMQDKNKENPASK